MTMISEFNSRPVDGLFEDWFLDYASYVILDRAIPSIDDGLKPVQRRILWALKELDDGRFNKAANVIGHTMRYHPHGDMAISDAMVKLAQRHFLMDLQGNWGNVATGDRAAAARYVEARLSKFAKDVVFTSPIPQWQASYDGRNKEPVTLPVKFPLLLVHGAEGIAVGLSTRILPHNFVEVAKASIAHLQNKPTSLYPDFATGGCIDISEYNDGKNGGRLLMRVNIVKTDDRTLVIDSLPFGVTTSSLIESILNAVEKGKVKIRKIEDNTSDKTEITIRFTSGTNLDQTIKALYAFTDCESVISCGACVIKNKIPTFLGVTDILRDNADRTMAHLKTELVTRLNKLNDQLHFLTLEQVFIQEKIYRKIEKSESFNEVIATITRALTKFSASFIRTLKRDDVLKLTEIKIKRISKYDQGQANEQMAKIQEAITGIEKNLKGLRQYTIAYFKYLIKEYGKFYPRKTKIESFDRTKAAVAALANIKLYVNRKDGFIGTTLRDGELLGTCTAFSQILVMDKKGQAALYKIEDKTFVGKLPVHIAIFDAKSTCHVGVISTGKNNEIWVKHTLLKMMKGRVQAVVNQDKAKILAVLSGTEPLVRSIKLKLSKGNLQIDFAEIALSDRKTKDKLVGTGRVTDWEEVKAVIPSSKPQEMWFDRKNLRITIKSKGIALGKRQHGEKLFTLAADGKWQSESVQTSYAFSDGTLWLLPISELAKKASEFICVIFDERTGQYEALRQRIDDAENLPKAIKLKRTQSIVLVSRFDRKRGDGKLKVDVRSPVTAWPAMMDVLKEKD